MNILSCYFGRQNRGCWKRLKRLLIYFAKNGHKVKILSCSNDQELLHENIKQVVLSINFLPQSINDVIFVIFAPIYCFFISLLEKFDQLIAFDGHNAFFLSYAKIINKKSKLVLLVRGHPVFQNKLNNYFNPISKAILFLDKHGHKKSDIVIYNSKATADSLRKLYKTSYIQSEIIYNDCRIIQSLSSKDRKEYRECLKISDRKMIIGFSGQLIARKNVKFLIETFSRIENKNEIMLLIKGNGPLKEELSALARELNIENWIRFLSWDYEMMAYYNAIDIFVLPSLYDDCSNSLMEAMGQSCCVLASDRGGNVEILDNRKEFLFSIDDNGTDLLQKLSQLINSPDELSRMKEILLQCRKKFVFHWEEQIESTINRMLH